SASLSQNPVTKPPDQDDPVVKISTDLIQVDVTVTDKNGKVVPDLEQADFEIFENGEKQNISNFAFLSRTASAVIVDGALASTPSPQSVTAASNKPLSRAGVHRTIAVVIDDLNLSFGSIDLARRSLRKFVNEQMQPDDLVAIVRTRGGIGALQQFTSDKRILHAAIDSLRWNPAGGSFDSLSSVSQNESDISERFTRESDLVGGGSSKQQTVVLAKDLAHDKKGADASRNAASQAAGIHAQTSLGAIKYVISGMKRLPGRKAMMLFSDGIEIGNDSVKERGSTIFGYLQDIADEANRASVVVYTFDTKGMRSMSIAASDNTYEIIDGHRGQKETARLKDFRDSQDGLTYFADRTGGRAFLNSDNLNLGIQRALDEQAGYYLLAYVPDAENFDPQKRRFNKLEIKLKRPDLKVSFRSGFFSGGSNADSNDLTKDKALASALFSPFTQNEIALNMSALYADDKSDGPYVRSFLHIDARNLKFHDEAGWKVATFDILAAAFGDNGMPAASKESKYTIKTRGATYDAMLREGFVYVLPVPLKKPGFYQFRVAVQDSETKAIGSAYQTVEIPDLSKARFALSGLAVENVSLQTWQNISAGKVGSRPGQVKIPSTLLYDTILRQFRAGSVLRYGCEVYSSATGGAAVIETRATIYHNDRVVHNGNLNSIDVSNQKDRQRVKLSGAITLADSLEPGDYILQITVSDPTGNKTARQLLPFEIVK
ncbi:MAG TPA: VWA domain-containing protein, partial [Pyrinomonadaceae bacterium]|nr:VWA domain-containing protein [Pyrinomonadaceae bacterium]